MTDDDERTSAAQLSQTTPAQAAEAVRERVHEEQDTQPTPPPRAAVVFNPSKVEQDVLEAAINAGAEAAGWRETLWLETSPDDPGMGMAKEALEAGVDLVIAAGGDGTVRCVCEVLAGSGVPVGLLPAGTGNLLARNLGLSLSNLEESITTAFTGTDRAVDVGYVELRRPDDERERHAFVVMAGLGLDAQMIVNTDDDLKAKVGWLAYVQAITKSIRGGENVHIRWKVDNHKIHSSHVHTLLIGNCGSLPGNVLLLPEAAIDDGRLDIVAMRPEGLVGWLQVWGKVLVENGILRRHEVGRKFAGPSNNVRAMRYETGSKIDVQLKKPVDFELDGDYFGEVAAFRAHVEQGALQVRVPD